MNATASAFGSVPTTPSMWQTITAAAKKGNASQLFSCAACAQRGKPSRRAIQSRGLRLS